MGKKIHLSLQEIQDKIARLQKQKKDPEVQNNKTKRKRVYAQLAKLQKALTDPDQLVVDPQQELQKIELDKQRRLDKKIAKKEDEQRYEKNKKRHQKRCLKCGSRQHLLAQCSTVKSGFCYKCGSQEHSHKECQKTEYALADCFYCGKKGHIARDCPDNAKGMYKKGGACFGCGSVRHTLKECPQKPSQIARAGKFKNNDEF